MNEKDCPFFHESPKCSKCEGYMRLVSASQLFCKSCQILEELSDKQREQVREVSIIFGVKERVTIEEAINISKYLNN